MQLWTRENPWFIEDIPRATPVVVKKIRTMILKPNQTTKRDIAKNKDWVEELFIMVSNKKSNFELRKRQKFNSLLKSRFKNDGKDPGGCAWYSTQENEETFFCNWRLNVSSNWELWKKTSLLRLTWSTTRVYYKLNETRRICSWNYGLGRSEWLREN